MANAAKVQTALKLSQEDQNTIASLKREIEKAWKMVDAAHEKEGRAKETIQQLKHEIQNLSRLVEQGAGLRCWGALRKCGRRSAAREAADAIKGSSRRASEPEGLAQLDQRSV